MTTLRRQDAVGHYHTMNPRHANAVAAYLDWMRVRGLRPDTIRTRRAALASIARDLGKPILAATPEDLTAWQIGSLGRDQWTRHVYARELRGYLQWCRTQRLCGPAMRLAVQAVRAPVGKPRPAPMDEVLAAIEVGVPRMKAWLALAAFAGLRAGEIARLRAEDVNVRDLLIEVRDGKGGRDRTILIGQGLVDALVPFMRPKGRLWEVRPITVSQLVSRHLREMGQPWTCHSLRHSYGTGLYQISRDLRLVQEQMGHASPATTALYVKPDSVAGRAAVGGWDAGLTAA